MIPQELSALMALKSGMKTGRVAATTPDGRPTMAMQEVQEAEAQLAPPVMGGMMPSRPVMPGVQGAAERAGIAGQIQAMQMQNAQQNLMRQAMAQQQAPGIEGLNPNIDGYAEGGIVGRSEPIGFAGGGMPNPIAWLLERLGLPTRGGGTETLLESREKDRARDMEAELEREAVRFSNDIPYGSVNAPVVAPAQPPRAAPPAPVRAAPQAPAVPAGGIAALPSTAQGMREAAMQSVGQISITPPGPQDILKSAPQWAEARRQYLISQGVDPNQADKDIADAQRRMQERMTYANKLAQELETRRSGIGGIPQGFIDFALGAQGFRGEGAGKVFRTGVQAKEAEAAAARQESQKINELRFAYEDAGIKEQQAFRKAKQDTAMGDWSSAQTNLAEGQRQANNRAVIEAELKGKFAHDKSQEEMKSAELKARYSELQQNKDGQQLLAAQQRVDAAMQLYEKAYEKAKTFLAMGDTKDPMMTKMRDDANAQLLRIENEVLNPARQVRDALQAKVLGVQMPKTPTTTTTGRFIVTTKDGKSFDFPSQEQADAFKRAAGIK